MKKLLIAVLSICLMCFAYDANAQKKEKEAKGKAKKEKVEKEHKEKEHMENRCKRSYRYRHPLAAPLDDHCNYRCQNRAW